MAADSYIFGGNTGLTYEELKRRRAIAQAIASRQRGYPKNVGEGLTYLGESIGDTIGDMRLRQAEKAQSSADAARIASLYQPSGAPAPQPPVTSAPPVAPRPPPVSAPPRAGPQAAAPIPRPPPPPPPPPPPVLPSGPSGEALTSGMPSSDFAEGGLLSPAPLAAPGLDPVLPEGSAAVAASNLPSSGYLPPAAAAAPPSLPHPPVAAPTVNPIDTAEYPVGPVLAPPTSELQPPPSPQWKALQDYRESQGLPREPPPDIRLRRPGGAPAPAPAPTEDAPGSILGSQSALDRFIAKQEGFRPTAYWDYKQYSIGHGTRGRPGETISREEAGQRLQSEVANARQSVEDFAPDAPPGVKDALTSLTYNAGSGWQQSGLGRMIREGRYDEARDRFQQYIKAGGTPLPGLVSRRQAELSNFWDQPQQDGGSNIRLASYAPSGGAGGAPVPGMGGAGAMQVRPRPQIWDERSPDEQVTPTDIEPAPAMAQFGPPVGRFSRSDAPMPGIPPAAALPPTAPLPPVGLPGAPAAPTRRPSEEPIPPYKSQLIPDPGPPPPRMQPRPYTREQRRALEISRDADAGPAAQAAAQQVFSEHEELRKRLEAQDESDYAREYTDWHQRKLGHEKSVREETEQQIKGLESRQKIEAERQKMKAGDAPPHATFDDVPVQWDQESGTWKEIQVQRAPSASGPPTIKLTKEQSDELQHLTKVRTALDQYNRIRDADKILAEGLKDELAGKVPFAGNALLNDKYRRVRNAANNFLQGHLRSTSGAAIGTQEMTSHYANLVPIYGDDSGTLRDKAEQREGIAQGMYVGLGKARPLFDYMRQERQKQDFVEQEKIRKEMPPNPEIGRVYKSGNRRRYWTGSRWEED